MYTGNTRYVRQAKEKYLIMLVTAWRIYIRCLFGEALTHRNLSAEIESMVNDYIIIEIISRTWAMPGRTHQERPYHSHTQLGTMDLHSPPR